MDICRIAMWSGPRNISTAMMRSFENRNDTWVVDEPFYGFYLQQTQFDHPGKDEIIEDMECDWRLVVKDLLESTSVEPRSIYYQKHMTHHVLPEIDLQFVNQLANVFLIRDPALIINSYAKVRPEFDILELGFIQQWSIYQHCLKYAARPPIILDSQQIIAAPEQTLGALCAALGIEFSKKMLNWPCGKRASDGIWAKYWYSNVESSTGFNQSVEGKVKVSAGYQVIYEQAYDIYQKMLTSTHVLPGALHRSSNNL